MGWVRMVHGSLRVVYLGDNGVSVSRDSGFAPMHGTGMPVSQQSWCAAFVCGGLAHQKQDSIFNVFSALAGQTHVSCAYLTVLCSTIPWNQYVPFSSFCMLRSFD